MAGVFTKTIDSELFKGTVRVNTGLFIGGKFVDSISTETIECVLQPYWPRTLH